MGHRNHRCRRRDLSSERADFLQSLRGERSSRNSNKDDHRATMFCRQVQRALTLALAGDVHDEMLQQLSVESVQPAPTCNHLLVQLGVPAGLSAPIGEWLARLERVKPVLRRAIAQTSSRKRVPDLSFMLVSPEAGQEVQP
jgi:ribosome-binding factor A